MTILWYNKLFCNSNDNYKIFDKILFSGVFIACINCFLMSAFFHLFGCHSRRVYKQLAKYYHMTNPFAIASKLMANLHSLRLDYFGISAVMMSAMNVWLYYGFYYSPVAQKVYITIFSIYCMALLVISRYDKFCEPECQRFRGVCFLIEGLYGE